MAAALGLKYVEIPLYWDSLGHWYGSRESTETILSAAREAGVKMVAGVSALNVAGRLCGKQIDLDGVAHEDGSRQTWIALVTHIAR